MKKIYTVAIAISTTIAAMAQIPTSGLVARYDFSSTANIYNDGTGNNLSLCEGTGSTTVVRLSENPARPVGDSAAFIHPYLEGGVPSYLNDCASTNEFHTASTSIAAWIKVEEFHPYNVIAGVRYNNSASPYNSIALNTNSFHQLEMGFSTNLQNDVSLISSTILEDSVWYHVVCTYDATTGTASMYLDGVLENTYTALASDLAYNANKKFVIGHVDGGETSCGGCSFGGLIDEVLFYGRALTATEVDAIYTADVTAEINDVEKTNTELTVYPNPAKEMLNINIQPSMDSPETIVITLVNILGETVGTHQLHTGNNIIDVNELKSGVYFIQSDNLGTTKFVKK